MAEEQKKIPKKKKHRVLRILAWILGILIVLIFLLLLFIRSPWGQNIIVQKAVNYVSGKTHTKVEIEKLFITFEGNILLKGLFLEDKKGDTLIYSKSLEADIPLLPLIRGNGIGIDMLKWKGLRANVIRKDSISGYNFQFLIDAFAGEETAEQTIDTVATDPIKIMLGQIDFEDFNIVFDDAVLGIDSHFEIGKLFLEMDKVDLKEMDFRASKALISDAKIKFLQTPVAPDPDSEDTPLPYVVLKKLNIKNVLVDYQSYGDRLAANLDISDLVLEIPKLDLPNNDIEITRFGLNNSILELRTQTENNVVVEGTKEAVKEVKEDIQAFEWPEFRIAINDIDLKDNKISYFVHDEEVKKDVFNANAIVLQEFNLQAKEVFLKDKSAGLNLGMLKFVEGSGLDLKRLSMLLDVEDDNLDLKDLKLALNNNILEGKLRLEYPALSKLIDAPEESKIAVKLPKFQVDLKDVFKFQPELRKNEYLFALSKKYLTGNVNASGYLDAINVPSLNVNWGKTTKISAHALIKNTTRPNNIWFDIDQFTAKTIRTDLLNFVDEKELGVNLPQDILIKGNAKGSPNDIVANVELNTSQGLATIVGHYKGGSEIEFDADLEIKEYKLNELLGDEQMGALSLTIKTSGHGKTINNLDAKLAANISSFKFNNYQIKDLNIDGDIKDGEGHVLSRYKDDNVDLDLDADIVLDSIATQVALKFNVIGADLQALGLMDRHVRTALKIDADFKGNGVDNFDVITTIGDGVVVYDDKTYLLGEVWGTAMVRKDTTSIWLDNKMIQLQLESNSDPATFGKSVNRHISSYFYRDAKVNDTTIRPVSLYLKGKIIQAPVLKDVFLVNVKKLDTVKIDIAYDELARKLKADINAPLINYSGNEIDSLAFHMDTDRDKFIFDLGFNEIKAGPFNIHKTMIVGEQANNELSLGFKAMYKDSVLINIDSRITGHRDSLRFHIVPKNLILNSKDWVTPENNEALILAQKLKFNDFNFTRNNQSVVVTDELDGITNDHVAIDFTNFKLSDILSYLNPKEELAKGVLDGNFVLEDPYTNTGILADLDISNFNFLNVDLGKMAIDAKSQGGDKYDFNLDIQGGEVTLDLVGEYLAKERDPELDLALNIKEFKMKALEGFSQGEIVDGEGAFSGDFHIKGSLKEPGYDGNLNFNDAGFKVAKLNAGFKLKNENLKINNKGLFMDNFVIRDENDNTFSVDGNVGTESFLNPTLDLKLVAKNFQVLNASEEDNEFLYGKASFDADVKITGDLDIPKIDMKVSVTKNTDVTYILPSSSANIEERGGVVIFVNREDPDAIITRAQEKTARLSGIDLAALIKLGKEAKIKIVIDKETGDNFQIYGDGDLNFTINPNGQMNLSGVYEIAGGHYEMNLYNLVNRRFELAKGGKVSWFGDPFDAKLDVRALYELEASASPLMAPQVSGSDPSVKNKYRQVLPFYVYLNVDGELSKPEISFNLDMPEDDQGAVGGQVYGRVQQVNNQEDELNRQVFSLLVLNRFYPESGSDGSTGGFAAVARDNINDAISDQLNVFSDKILGKTGLELDFGLDSYTDYQGETPQERTQLDIAAQKKLFNDRLIVRVGSEVDIQGSSQTDEATPLIGNVSLEYLITQDGRYRLKGFHKNEFENVIDGQTIVSGLALIFTQEFNKFTELWDAIITSEKKKEQEADKEKEKKSSNKDSEKNNKKDTENNSNTKD